MSSTGTMCGQSLRPVHASSMASPPLLTALPELGTSFGTESKVGLMSCAGELLASAGTSLLGADLAASVAALPDDWGTSGV